MKDGFHPARGCISRLREHQRNIDTDFRLTRANFAKIYPPVPQWKLASPPRAQLDAILAEIIEKAPARLTELKEQLARCLCWELQEHGKHICSGVEVSERTIRALYQGGNLEGLIVHAGASKIGRQDLLALPTPLGTTTHVPVPHSKIVEALLESLAYRHLTVVKDEYAVTPNGMRMFGFLELEIEESGVRISLGIRNSHDKSFSLGLTVGFRVIVCDNLSFFGDYSPVMKKHTKHLDLDSVIGPALEKMQRNFKPLIQKIDVWRNHSLADDNARLIIYKAFIEEQTALPKHLMRAVHTHYFEPEYEDFKPRTLWSLQNGFTSAIKKLEPVPQFQAATEVATYFNSLN